MDMVCAGDLYPVEVGQDHGQGLYPLDLGQDHEQGLYPLDLGQDHGHGLCWRSVSFRVGSGPWTWSV